MKRFVATLLFASFHSSAVAFFNRIATFSVCQQLEANCDVDTPTNALDVTVSSDDTTLIYADSLTDSLGFVSLSDPSAPTGITKLDLSKTPIAVEAIANSKVVAISVDAETNASDLFVIDVVSRVLIHTLPLTNGPAASFAVTQHRIVVASLGAATQTLTIIDSSSSDPALWSVQKELEIGSTQGESKVDVAIREEGDVICAVSLATSNTVVYVNLTDDATVMDTIALGDAPETLWMDVQSNDVILQRGLLPSQPRQPQAVTWMEGNLLATADLGSRSWTGWNMQSRAPARFSAREELDHEAVRVGHYPEVCVLNCWQFICNCMTFLWILPNAFLFRTTPGVFRRLRQ